jgi:hypothetical protein
MLVNLVACSSLCNKRLWALSDAREAVASAIRLDQSLEHLTIELEISFTTFAIVALAEALTSNKTLRKITLSVDSVFNLPPRKRVTLGAQAYEAFA